jgi:hypothetical protein
MDPRRSNELGIDYVFVVRLWREPGSGARDSKQWRGQVSHRNKRRHFVGLQMLFKLMREMLPTQPPLATPRQTSLPRRKKRHEL